ncbi:MAG: CAP domain-containing protein [Leptospiraceae bacterium]|nr:CAP domain-containing protein [Leptospiraceae bacterium]
MKTILFFLFFSLGIFSADKASVDNAYKELSTTWSYKSKQGEIIRVKNLKKSCQGDNCMLVVNGKILDPSEIGFVSKEEQTQSPKEEGTPIPGSSVTGNEPSRLKGITEAHNIYRRGKNVPDLVWDESIASYAQEWADNLKKTRNCKMQHRSTNKYGENLAWAMGKQMSTYDVVKMWNDEEKDYDYKANTCNDVCGHYTQVVWKTSKRLGCAVTTCGNSEVWVCNYDPPGNMNNARPY